MGNYRHNGDHFLEMKLQLGNIRWIFANFLFLLQFFLHFSKSCLIKIK